MIYHCCNELRRNALKGSPLNGIDYLEVIDKDAPIEADRQRFLEIHFVNDMTGAPLSADNILIEGGDRVTGIQVVSVTAGAGTEANVLTVEVDKRGDFSIYTLKVVQSSENVNPPDGYDPVLSSIDFSFKVECPSDFDCAADCFCTPQQYDEPEIDYLARDYASLRRLILDRMAVLLPAWRERSPADLGVALAELLAYVGDHLSYQQDAVATEAYLDTARSRISVRRHALLVDYEMHDGCNARTWVQIQVSADALPAAPGTALLPKGTQFLTRIVDQGLKVEDKPEIKRKARAVFETLEVIPALFKDHNQISFYTWSDRECCLPAGATSATLSGHLPNLLVGDVLIFEEVLGPDTGVPGDADLEHRQPVRLTKVRFLDDSSNPLTDPLTGDQITEIEWGLDDALPFPLCISARTESGDYIEDVSVAMGNIVLADHGMTMEEDLGIVPGIRNYLAPEPECDPCDPTEKVPIQPRFRPLLKMMPLTQQAPYSSSKSAYKALHWKMEKLIPAIALASSLDGDVESWTPAGDLLNHDQSANAFVAEIESDGRTYLRFGDDDHGARPEAGMAFTATYRVGNGRAGNIGAESLVHIVSNLAEIEAVRNPLPARGGVEPETIENVRRRAPSAFRTQERAVTPQDYADKLELDPQVQRGAATFRWTGSWHTVFLTIDRLGGRKVDAELKEQVRGDIERYRMAGYDLEVDGPRFVALEIEMTVCLEPEYFRSQVRKALLQLFSNRVLPDGTLGLFHPDRFTFGQTVHLSPLYAAAQAVPGVYSVVITKFQRLNIDSTKPIDDGWLKFNRLEIPRLDNDPNYPQRGVFKLTLEGGR